MKVRNGFVSNSSSSSFYIATKDGTLDTLDKFKIKANKNPFAILANEAISKIKEIAEGPYTLEEVIKELYEEEFLDHFDKNVKDWKFFIGSFNSNSDSEIERFLCSQQVNITKKDFILISDSY